MADREDRYRENLENEESEASEVSERRSSRARRSEGRSNRDRRRFGPPRSRACRMCVDKVKAVDYKSIDLLRQFISPSGRIMGRRKTRVCAKHQRMIARAIKRARHVALLPYTAEHVGHK